MHVAAIEQRTANTADFFSELQFRFIDLIFTRLDSSPALLHNVSADDKSIPHHWLAMKLEGKRSNRDGFGARVKVTQDGATQTREVRSNFSYLSASDPRPHFGFGSNAHAVDIQVYWPSGTVDTLQNIAVDRFILLKEESSPISRQSNFVPTRPLHPAP